MVIQVVHCAKEARHLFLQFERRVLGNSPIPLREHVQSLPVCPGGPGLGHPSASRPHLPSLEVLNRIEWTLPNPPSVGPGRREREFPGPRSKLGGERKSLLPQAHGPGPGHHGAGWLQGLIGPCAHPGSRSLSSEVVSGRGCVGRLGAGEQERQDRLWRTDILFQTHSVSFIYSTSISWVFHTRQVPCYAPGVFHLIESSQKPQEASLQTVSFIQKHLSSTYCEHGLF